MTTTVVSLFLPYTVDFHDLPTPSRRPSPTRRNESIIADASSRQHSLFQQPTPPRTPAAAAADASDFFAQAQPGAATHFLKAHDPRALVRSDAHVSEWGHNSLFNQPRLRGAALPPETILKYVQAARDDQSRQAADADRHHARTPSTRHHRRRMTGQSKFPNTPIRSRAQSTDTRNASGAAAAATEWTIEPALQGNGGLYNAVRAAEEAGTVSAVSWLGTVGFPTDSLDDDVKHAIRAKLLAEYSSRAVFVNDSDLDGHYTHYCKTILWPIFHYQVPDHPKSKAYEDHSYTYYVNLNQAFADAIVESYADGDTIWVNDYHLLLVPGMLRARLPDAQIGFFLHTAFPSSEVFRCLAVRRELLHGILGANLVAFQSPEYSYHFLSTCGRVLAGVEASNDGVHTADGRLVNVAAIPIGVDPRGLSLARAEPEVKEWIDVMQRRYDGKKLIVARDQLDSIRGVRQKLLAFELFLNKYPEWADRVVLMQVATSTADNAELVATVSDIQTRIDTDHSSLAHQPLVLLRQDIAFSQYLALLSVADALLITSLRDGMNLTTHEFVLCQDGRYAAAKRHGPIILSEFTGSASVLGPQVLSINPWDYQRVADAIAIALAMPDVEKERRYRRLRDVVVHQNGEAWCHSLFKKLARAQEP